MNSPARVSVKVHPAALWFGRMGPWLAVAALALWSARPGGASLVLASAGVVAGLLWRRERATSWAIGTVILMSGIVGAFAAHRQVALLQADWPAYWEQREAEVGVLLDEELQRRLENGEEAAGILADLGSEPTALPATQRLTQLRSDYGLTAVALYDSSGRLRAWDGVHRGRVPDGVQRGLRRYVYHDQPLFGYLYITAPAGGAGTAVAAFLLRSDLPGRLGAGIDDFATRFRAEVGERVSVFSAPLAEGQGGWELKTGDRVLLSVVVDPPRPADRIARVLHRWRLGVASAGLLAWLLLAFAGPPVRTDGVLAAGTLFAVAAWAPPPPVAAVEALFNTSLYALPGPFSVSLGRTAALALALVTLVAVLPRPDRRRLPPWLAGLSVGLAAPILLAWIKAGAAPDALAGGQALWLTYQGAATTLVGALLASTLVFARSDRPRRRASLVASGLGAVLAGVGAYLVWTVGSVPWWFAGLVGLPAGIAATSMGAWKGWRRSFAPWVLAVLLACSMTVPVAWGHRVEARLAVGERTLRGLASVPDADLESDLYRVAAVADSLDARGDDGVELLYGALRRSGLSDSGHPVWMTLWSGAGIPQEELRVGVGLDRPAATDAVALAESGPGPELLEYDRSEAQYVMKVPLRERRLMTVTAPPFSEFGGRSPLAPLLGGGAPTATDPLTLIPLGDGDAVRTDQVSWKSTDSGWQGELPLVYPDAAYHAHYAVDLPGALLAVARGTLLIVLNLLMVLAFWLLGRALLRPALPREATLRTLVISFQARVTLALFGFFVLANAIFGTVAYRTIDRASHRAAVVLAERVAEDAAGWYFEESGAMELLARRVGAELLEYRDGELREGSVEELVELGLYEGWVPFQIYQLLDGREGIRASEETALGRWDYVTSYRRLPDGDLLAAQIPLQAGATAVRSADVLQLLAFAVIMGALLSLVLALLVGRTLTRPIQALQVASERVGAGNLALRLPDERSDEFGAVFRAFNRMVNRLRRARRQLVRETRRTQAIMEEAAVGMVALDPDGAVTMVNPRAEELVGAAMALGQPLPAAGELGAALAVWVKAYLASDETEAGSELSVGDRRIRVRGRRLDASGRPGGAVLALEDVTDELRTERVLAWGEMARQVAHEVKNPLTPMKLSVQHIRRAWDDGREDFGSILVKNADAMESEIDRLAAIATSFSRFGAPGGGAAADVTAVDVGSVVGEIVALYGAGDGGVSVSGDVPAGLPRARCREAELKEVLVNLLENARDAQPGEGTVTIRARDAGGRRISVHVIDDGAGIPEELMPRVFEPHFSTRSRGTGLGLAIVRRLVESWGGEVDLKSESGAGTEVVLTLRVAETEKG